MTPSRTTEFEHMFNAMERASLSNAPFANGYAAKRKAVLDYVATLRRELNAALTRESVSAAEPFDPTRNASLPITTTSDGGL